MVLFQNKKPLIIKGARQVGKTYSIRKFGKKRYKNVVEINFEKQMKYVQLFNRTRNPKDILDYLKPVYLEVPFDENDILFLGEIQACSSAITALKFLKEELKCDVICSGSLLGIAIASLTSFPVGYVETWEMYPLDFYEFLSWNGLDNEYFERMDNLYDTRVPFSDVVHERFNSLFKDYVVIGGMPEVVKEFVESKSYRNALLIQRRIIDDYYNDMAKYASGSERIKARECYSSIPLQLVKDNKKFQYKVVKEGYNARYYDSSLRWLEDSGLIIKTNKLLSIQKPLEVFADLANFKIYHTDTGLLISMFDDSIIKEIISGNLGYLKG